MGRTVVAKLAEEMGTPEEFVDDHELTDEEKQDKRQWDQDRAILRRVRSVLNQDPYVRLIYQIRRLKRSGMWPPRETDGPE